MLTKRALISLSRVSTVKTTRNYSNNFEKCDKIPKSSPGVIDKKSIESRYDECEQLLRVRKLQNGIKTVRGVFKGEFSFSDIKSSINLSYLKSLEKWSKFVQSNEFKTAKECTICSFILSYKGMQVARERLPVLIQEVKDSKTYKIMKKQGMKYAEDSYNFAKKLLEARSSK